MNSDGFAVRKVFAQLVLVVLAVGVPALAQSPASVAGTVRDSTGEAQIGVLVQLLNSDSNVLATAYSDQNGHYQLHTVSAGTFQVRATAAMFLPTVRKDVAVNLGALALVDLTLNTLSEVMQWLPAQSRSPAEPQDDWDWTLRSPANRPVLRDFDPTMVIATQTHEHKTPTLHELKARGSVFNMSSGFAASGVHQALTLDDAKVRQHSYGFHADIAPSGGQSASATATTQFEETPGQLTRMAANYQWHSDLLSSGTPLADSAGTVMGSGIVRIVHTSNLGAGVQLETGSELVQVGWGDRVAASHPFVAMELRPTEYTSVTYGVSTAPEFARADDVDTTIERTPLAAPSIHGLTLEHGIHQQVQWRRDTGDNTLTVLYFHDQVDEPLLQGIASAAAFESLQMVAGFDAASNLFREVGNSFSAQGVGATVGHQFSFANAQISVLHSAGLSATPASPGSSGVETRAIPAELAEVSLNGLLPSARTRWRVSYGAENPGVLTPISNFDRQGPAPYLNFAVHQPLHTNNLEALVEVRNLLAQGYHPFVAPDGETIYFVQVPRTVQGGLVFSF
jgi:hypothetical protein